MPAAFIRRCSQEAAEEERRKTEMLRKDIPAEREALALQKKQLKEASQKLEQHQQLLASQVGARARQWGGGGGLGSSTVPGLCLVSGLRGVWVGMRAETDLCT